MQSAPEPIHVIDEWYDGPRTGAADYRGAPHHYRSLYLDNERWDPDEDRYELTPLTAEALAWMTEADQLFQRWDAARQAGTLPPEATEEALGPDAPGVFPADRGQFLVLERRISEYLAGARSGAFIMRGEFISGANAFRWSDLA
jgi:hypothetical protein